MVELWTQNWVKKRSGPKTGFSLVNRFVTDFVRVDPKLVQPFSQHKIAPKADITTKKKRGKELLLE